MSERLLSASVCLLLLTSMAPTVTAVGPSDSVIWGISYDWANYENDIEEITGIDTNAANEDLEAAADYAGFLLESDQVISGMTQFFIESWDDDETVEITDANGDTHEVTKRVTELTIRHGNLGDMGFTAAWTDENESIDIWMSASTEQLFVIDAAYTEYVDDELMVYGGDLDMSGEFALESNMEFNLQVIAANEVLAPELGMGFSVSFEIPSINSQWRTDEPLDYLHHLSEEPTDDSNDSTDNGSVGDEYQSGLIEGDFSTITGYSMMLSIEGIPAEDFDINLDAFNVQLSDSIPGQGIFSEEMNVLSGAAWDWECPPVGGVENVNINPSSNETVSAQCGLAPPISMGMASMMAISMMSALDSGVQELFSAIEEQVGAWMEEIAPEEDTFVCDNGEEIPAEWENDGEIDCEDGSDENESGGGGTYTCDNGQVIPEAWVNDGEEDCEDGSDEDGSEDVFQKYIDMFEALNNSNLEKTMEAFGEKLEGLLEDNDPSEPLANLDDMCPIMFWDTSNSRVLGMALMATDEGDDYEVLLGPEILGVKQHSYELSILYLTGQDAADAKLDALGLSELRDLAPESKHDVEELYDILGEDFLPDLDQTDTDGDGVIDFFDQDDDGDGMFDWEDSDPLSPPVTGFPEDEIDTIPGPTMLAVITMLGAAAILMPRRED
ncbi:MAG: low-density lipoprotein receptor class A repeat-containing protein [Candidatus Thalassarchaeum sp.]|nr:low-density lipoprotein receptor class A repeat-containing protein [Candidatus Thalassarchaeum sp.]